MVCRLHIRESSRPNVVKMNITVFSYIMTRMLWHRLTQFHDNCFSLTSRRYRTAKKYVWLAKILRIIFAASQRPELSERPQFETTQIPGFLFYGNGHSWNSSILQCQSSIWSFWSIFLILFGSHRFCRALQKLLLFYTHIGYMNTRRLNPTTHLSTQPYTVHTQCSISVNIPVIRPHKYV